MVKTSRLRNGVRVLTENIPHAISVSAGIWILRGSRSEPSEWNGITHFVEHLLFKGTESRTALDISREIESVGGSLNAFTGKEFTCLHARALHSHLPLIMGLLTDIFLHSTLPEEEIERERQVILQEINMVEDSPEELVHELFAGAYWRGHPLGRSTLGTKEIIGCLDRENLAKYTRLLRDPERVLLTASGRLEHEEVVRIAEESLDFPENPSGDLTLEKPSPHRGLNLHLKELGQAHICLGTLGYPYSHPRRYGYHVLNTLLGGGMSSRLFQEVREKRGLAYSVYSFQAAYFDAGMLGVYVGTGHEAVTEVVELLAENFSLLKNEDVTSEELRIAKEQLKGNLLLSTESTGSRMSKLAMNQIYFGKQLEIDDVIEEIERVDADDVRAISGDLFRSEYLGLTVLGDIDRDALASINIDC
jgi:predicted Zn-dependent peptidase